MAVDGMVPAHLYWVDGVPYAEDFQDLYFSREGVRGETAHVFLAGNGLPERWIGQTFTLGETGFGTGLNFLCVLAAFARSPWAHLTYISFEKHPLCPEDLRRAYELVPELAGLGEALLAVYPDLLPGRHELRLEAYHCTLVLIFAEIDSGFDLMRELADAWFLDGFAPALNPEMWSEQVCQALFARTVPSGTFATYTAAGTVRRNLRTAGFEVKRVPGYGPKWHMLQGHRPDEKGASGEPDT